MRNQNFCLLSVLLLLGLAAYAVAQDQSSSHPVAQPPSAAVASSPPVVFSREVKKTIAIIYTTCKDDPQTYEGTGFFVAKPDPRLGSNKAFGYLVTNKHVVLPHIESGQPCAVTNQKIRVNLKTADPATGARNFFFTNNIPWTYPTDDNIDLAVIPFTPDQTTFDVQAFPIGEFATSDVMQKQNIAEGDPVIYTGYFYQFPGSLHSEPIVRQGIVAMLPVQPIITTLGKPGKGYLADAHVFGGNSGSPMFVNIGGVRNGVLASGYHYLFLGVVSGLEREDDDGSVQPVVTDSGKVSGNSGISFIVPADQVADLINGSALTAIREEQLKRLPLAGATNPDKH